MAGRAFSRANAWSDVAAIMRRPRSLTLTSAVRRKRRQTVLSETASRRDACSTVSHFVAIAKKLATLSRTVKTSHEVRAVSLA